jgi:hypothetical protein
VRIFFFFFFWYQEDFCRIHNTRSSHPLRIGFPCGLLLKVFRINLYYIFRLPHDHCMLPQHVLFHFITLIIFDESKVGGSSLRSVLHPHATLFFLGKSRLFSSAPFSNCSHHPVLKLFFSAPYSQTILIAQFSNCCSQYPILKLFSSARFCQTSLQRPVLIIQFSNCYSQHHILKLFFSVPCSQTIPISTLFSECSPQHPVLKKASPLSVLDS